jgi:LmbE family N-acetylglucosaminyl deacetylase
VRRREAEAAGRHLGAASFYFLEHGDSTLSDVRALSVEIASVIRAFRPEVVFCPDPWLNYEGHLDHTVTGRATANAFHLSGVSTSRGWRRAPWSTGHRVLFYLPFQRRHRYHAVLREKNRGHRPARQPDDPETLAMYAITSG